MRAEIRPEIAKILPKNMHNRPIDHRSYPVPWFVTEKDAEGRWDFRPVDPRQVVLAIKQKVCWICGRPLSPRRYSFAVGPMCGVNRISGEPPQHLSCAMFAVRACPFMLLPSSKRRTAGLPDDVRTMPGAIKRNPGVTLLWSTKRFRVIPNDPGYLFQMGKPTATSWWKEGRRATRDEIDHALETGLPTLQKLAAEDGMPAEMALSGCVSKLKRLLPA